MPRKLDSSSDVPFAEQGLPLAATVVGAFVVLALFAAAGARPRDIPAVEVFSNLNTELERTRVAAVDVERDVHQLDSQIKHLDAELNRRRENRELIATLLVAGEKELADRRARLDRKSQGEYDLARNLAVAKADLERLERERLQLDAHAPNNLKVESYPTPLAKPVDGKELHIQLRGGRVSVVPIEELVTRLKNTVKEKVYKLRDYPELTDTVGPVDGFRMRYTLVRVDGNGRMSREPGQGSYVQLDHWEMVPVSSDLGEPWQEAISSTSLLRSKLDETNPRQWTVTLWVYPDSFDAFRALRKEFYQLGYHVAGRPLPDGIQIGGSPRGTKSAAQ